jgi:hypothetical protein
METGNPSRAATGNDEVYFVCDGDQEVTPGDIPVKNAQSAPPTRVRLYSHVTKTRFLHVEDALNIGKVRLFAGTYSRGQGMATNTSHYLDLADARIVFFALLQGEQGFSYREYKGTPPLAPGQPALSRVLSVDVKADNVYVELKSGPGRLTPTGAIQPQGRAATEVNVGFKLYEARRLATEVLAYLQAWDVYRMMIFQEMTGQPPAYLLSPSTGRVEIPDPDPHSVGEPAGAANTRQTLVDTPDTSRPASGNGPQPEPNGAGREPSDRPAAAQPDKTAVAAAMAEALFGTEEALHYGNGRAVDMANAKEVATFRHYVADKGRPPVAKTALQAYYQQQMMS